MKNSFIKKSLSIIFGLALAFSFNFASAQNAGVNVNGICLQKNDQGQCIRWGSVSIGTNQAGAPGQPGVQGQQQMGQQPPAGAAYSTGNYQRGSNSADLSVVRNLLGQIGGLISMLPPILLGAAVVVFFWNLIKFLTSKEADGKAKGKQFMIWSLVAIFIMVALWGIIAFFGDMIGINPTATVQAPQLPR